EARIELQLDLQVFLRKRHARRKDATHLVEVSWRREPERERVDAGEAQAEARIELNGRKRRRQVRKQAGGIVEMPPFVVGRDDERAHVARRGKLHGRVVALPEVIIVQIDEVEAIALDGAANDVRGPMSGKTDVANDPLPLVVLQ